MNRPIRTLAVGSLILFTLLLVNINYIQVFRASALNNDFQTNPRARDASCARKRGDILIGGNPAAKSVPSDDSDVYRRVYTHPKLYAPVTGFFSCIYGTSGTEGYENSILSGDDASLFVNRVIDLFDDTPPQGGSVQLTIDPAAQKAAYDGLEALGSKTQGAVIALDPTTGAILAAVSTPSYNPNVLTVHDASSVIASWKRLQGGSGNKMLNRGMQEIYPPGSTFKLITASAALSSGYSPNSMVPGWKSLNLPDTSHRLHNEDPTKDCGANRISLTEALDVSCNVSFGWLGLRLGAKALQDQAEKFGFNDRPFDQLATAQSVFPSDIDSPETALSAIGQFDVAATPLQMAMVAAGIANGGAVMKPYIVSELQSPDLDQIGGTPQPQVLSQAISTTVAKELTTMMVSVVTSGTATGIAIPGVSVAGKTGTANSSRRASPYAWMVSFAPATGTPKVAVAVLVARTSTPRQEVSGGALAGPIAKAVMEAVLQ